MNTRGKGKRGRKIILVWGLFVLIVTASLLPSTKAFSIREHSPSSTLKKSREILHFPRGRSPEIKNGEKGESYREIRKRYRILEFLSLGSLMVLAFALIWYLLRIKGKSEGARKVTAERYRVKELDTESGVHAHLEELLSKGISFSLTSRGERYKGRLCEIDHAGDIFHLDQISPPGLERAAGGNGKVKIEYLYDEVPYTFIALIEGKEEGKSEVLTFKVWGIIKYTQRRHSYRVRPSPLEPVVCLLTGSRGKEKRHVIDLSSGGVSVVTQNEYQEGDQLKCILSLPGEKKVRLSGSVVYTLARKGEEGDKERCMGISFITPGMEEEKALMKYVTRTRKG